MRELQTMTMTVLLHLFVHQACTKSINSGYNNAKLMEYFALDK